MTTFDRGAKLFCERIHTVAESGHHAGDLLQIDPPGKELSAAKFMNAPKPTAPIIGYLQ